MTALMQCVKLSYYEMRNNLVTGTRIYIFLEARRKEYWLLLFSDIMVNNYFFVYLLIIIQYKAKNLLLL